MVLCGLDLIRPAPAGHLPLPGEGFGWAFRNCRNKPSAPSAEIDGALCRFWQDHLLRMYSSMALAACLPAPMARITVAAPVTASPPA